MQYLELSNVKYINGGKSMGSRIIHYCISDKICKIIEVDKERFLMGNLVVDLPQLLNKPKDEAHFMKRYKNELKYDYNFFFEKYKNRFHDSFFLGYFCHLISDDVWLYRIVNKYFNAVSPDKELLKRYYFDFNKLNGRLIEFFNVKNNIAMIENIEIDELDTSMIATFVEAVNRDFNYSSNLLVEPLEVLNFEEIVDYINEAVERSFNELVQRAILNWC
jgi:hypothetical protein